MAKKSRTAPVASLLSVLALAAVAALVWALPMIGDGVDAVIGEKAGRAPASTAEASVDVEGDYYQVTGTAVREHEPTKDGEVAYCPLDRLKRATCAYAELTGRAGGDSEGIDFDTPGWTGNAEVEIPALPGVEGSKDYHGWFYNRSHLVADSLGGGEIPANMVTGTRTQNVGSTQVRGQYAGGMAHAELIAREYIDSGQAEGCPLYYAARPDYTGDELVPRTVTVDVQSCDRSIDERVVVANAAEGWAIDYATGAHSRER